MINFIVYQFSLNRINLEDQIGRTCNQKVGLLAKFDRYPTGTITVGTLRKVVRIIMDFTGFWVLPTKYQFLSHT